jgi:hypothetical protein
MDNIFAVVGSNIGIANTSGTIMRSVARGRNSFYSCATQESGFGDTVSLVPAITESSIPYVNAGSRNLLVSDTANSAGFAFVFPNFTTTTSTFDIGATQRPVVGGGGGATAFAHWG